MDAEVFRKVVRITMEAYGVDQELVTPETRWGADLHDSLEYVEVIMECEDVFGITIPDEDAIACDTVGKLATYISRKLGR